MLNMKTTNFNLYNMPKKTLILSVVIICSMLLITCKKYPEGGFTKRAPKKIIGQWKITLFEVNGIDSTELINYNGDELYKKVTFQKEDTKYYPRLYGQAHGGNNATVTFNLDNTVLNFETQSYYGGKDCGGIPLTCIRNILFPESQSSTWKIIKLNRKELFITSQQKNNYLIKLICNK
jgi:hypothetical protein